MSLEDRSPSLICSASLGVLCALLAACGAEEVEQPEALATKKYATGFSASVTRLQNSVTSARAAGLSYATWKKERRANRQRVRRAELAEYGYNMLVHIRLRARVARNKKKKRRIV